MPLHKKLEEALRVATAAGFINAVHGWRWGAMGIPDEKIAALVEGIAWRGLTTPKDKDAARREISRLVNEWRKEIAKERGD